MFALETVGLFTKICKHSQIIAKVLGYEEMHFKIVLESNKQIFIFWTKLVFYKVRKIHRAFDHPHNW